MESETDEEIYPHDSGVWSQRAKRSPVGTTAQDKSSPNKSDISFSDGTDTEEEDQM